MEQLIYGVFWYGICLSPLWFSLLLIGFNGWRVVRVLKALSQGREMRLAQWFFVLDWLEPFVGFVLFLSFLALATDTDSQSESLILLLLFPSLNLLMACVPLIGLGFGDKTCRQFSLKRALVMWSRWIVNFAGWLGGFWFSAWSGEFSIIGFFVWICIGVFWLYICAIWTNNDYEKFMATLRIDVSPKPLPAETKIAENLPLT